MNGDNKLISPVLKEYNALAQTNSDKSELTIRLILPKTIILTI